MLGAGSPARKACGRTDGAPPRRHPPDPRTHGCHHQRLRDFAEGKEAGTLGWGEGPGLSGWARRPHECPYKREAGLRKRRTQCDHRGRGRSDVAASPGMRGAAGSRREPEESGRGSPSGPGSRCRLCASRTEPSQHIPRHAHPPLSPIILSSVPQTSAGLLLARPTPRGWAPSPRASGSVHGE